MHSAVYRTSPKHNTQVHSWTSHSHSHRQAHLQNVVRWPPVHLISIRASAYKLFLWSWIWSIDSLWPHLMMDLVGLKGRYIVSGGGCTRTMLMIIVKPLTCSGCGMFPHTELTPFVVDESFVCGIWDRMAWSYKSENVSPIQLWFFMWHYPWKRH